MSESGKKRTREQPLSGRTALVTGSTSGIGLAIARALGEAGADVVCSGFGEPEAIKQQVEKLREEFRVRCVHVDADVSTGEGCRKLVKHAETAFGTPVDVLVNNAGIQTVPSTVLPCCLRAPGTPTPPPSPRPQVAPIDEFPDDRWDQILSINLSSNFHTIKAALPGMKRRGWGRIINVASVHGLVASPHKCAYVAAKHGVVGLTKCVALEAAETGVTCNAICPAFVRTPLVEGQVGEQQKATGLSREQVVRDVILGSQPTKRFVEAEDVAAMAAFLAGPHAGEITGSAMAMDGGWSAR
jgi:3-hydroxybutyrate dehydrogenase